MKKLFFQFAVVAAFGLMMSETATAQSITGTDTFVGINEGNTDPQGIPGGTFTSPTNGFGLWSSNQENFLNLRDSTNTVLTGTAGLEANNGDTNIVTTLSGLADGTYEIGIVYGSASPGNPLFFNAGLAGQAQVALAQDPGDSIATSGFQYAPGFTFITPFRTILGTAVVSGGNDIEIEINTGGNDTGNFRSALNGVTFELVGGSTVPEPSSLALLGLGGLVGLTRRRR